MIVLTETTQRRFVPDTIQAQLRIHTHDASYQQCRERLEQRAELILSRLRDLPPAAHLHIEASHVRVLPQYDREKQSIFTGFEGHGEITARFSNHTETLQMFYTAMLLMEDAPILEISSFLSNPGPAREAVLNEAVSRGTETARTVAAAAGRKLGELVHVFPEVYIDQAVVGEDGPTLHASEIEVTAHVEMKFRFA